MSDVVIVGAGLAGLCCARRLAQCGIDFQIVEASDGVGGRVRTDRVDGFQLDRGFQIYLPAYPEGRRVLDLEALDLKPFTRGVLVRSGQRFHRLQDPRFGFLSSIPAIWNKVGSLGDKLKFVRMKWQLDRGPLDRITVADDGLTLDYLRWTGGFSQRMIDQLFRAYLGGVFLERELTTSSRLFRWLFRIFGEGGGAVPAAGMQAIPDQIAANLPKDTLLLQAPVQRIEPGEVTLVNGETLPCRTVVVATDGPAAAKLLGGGIPDGGSRGTVTLWFAADRSPVGEPTLVLNGDETGPVNNLVVMSDAAPAYAPTGQALIAASVVGIPTADMQALQEQVRTQLQGWYGDTVKAWRLLRIDTIPHALPDQSAGQLEPWQRPVRLRPGLYVCGDHRDQGSIDGAMTSGFRAAQAVAEDLHAKRA